MRVNLEYFIAKRSAQAPTNQEPSIMMRVATIAVSLSIITMIITIAIIGGFKVQINNKLSGISGHILLTDSRGAQSPDPILLTPSLDSLISTLAPARKSTYTLRGAIARANGIIHGVMVKGVDSLYNAPFFGDHLTHGELPHFSPTQSKRDVIISKELADDMQLEVNDRLELLFTSEGDNIDRLTFKVAAIFSAGVGDMERGVVITNIETIRRIAGLGDTQASGIEVWLPNMNLATPAADDINRALIFEDDPTLYNITATSIERLYPSLFDWLKTHDINGVIVIVIMLIVALFNMVTALLILVLERTRMIGILKSLGMNNNSLQRIFLYRAFSVILKGLAWGNAIAIPLCLAQQHWGIIKLESSGYMLSEVPIELRLWWVAALNVGVISVVLLVMILPTRIVATITPDEIVKYR